MNKSNPAVFVIEDDKELGPLLEFMFAHQGFAVTLLTDGHAATRVIDSSLQPPALVLLEALMPFSDGYATLSRLRKRGGWEDVPVLMLSGIGDEEDVVRAFDLGADDYVTKPFQPAELLARAKRLVAAP